MIVCSNDSNDNNKKVDCKKEQFPIVFNQLLQDFVRLVDKICQEYQENDFPRFTVSPKHPLNVYVQHTVA